MKKAFVLMLIVLLSALEMVFASGRNDNGGNSENRTITDMAGRTVTVPKTVNRVLADWQSGTDIVLMLGGVNKLVAISNWYTYPVKGWSWELFPELENVTATAVAQPRGDEINVEGVLNLGPQVIFTDRASHVSYYESIGLPVIVVNLDNYINFKQSVLIIGEVLGEQEYAKAQAFTTFFNTNVELVTSRVADLEDAQKPLVYYMYGTDVFSSTVGRGEIQESWITMAGGKLATDDLQGRLEDGISPEYILNKNPDFLVLGAQYSDQLWTNLHSTAVMDILSDVNAIRNNKYVRNPQGMSPWCRTGPEVALQIVWAAKQFHPALFADVDIEALAKQFYQTVMGLTVSDENLAKMLQGRLTPTGS
jgi:iron complex transport system substrate-binding protein